MTPTVLTRAMLYSLRRLTFDDLLDVLIRLRQPAPDQMTPHALRLRIACLIRDAADHPEALLTVANAMVAVSVGWHGAPILTAEDFQG